MPAARECVSKSAEETERAGERLGERLGPGSVVALSGELGTGKTCFVRGLARGLGVSQTVSSPTFVLVNHYHGRVPLFHVDAYRTQSLTELLDLGLDDYLGSDGITVIEWADKLRPLLPAHTIWVHLDGLGDEPRTISIAAPAGGRI
jgi:tRNA threonylcarbamoyladenosine biosynthesis protein TsaE